MLRVQPVYHVSPAPSNPLIGLHPGMLTHIPSPGITGTSGQPKNENSYTIQLGLRLLEHFLNEELPIPVAFHLFI